LEMMTASNPRAYLAETINIKKQKKNKKKQTNKKNNHNSNEDELLSTNTLIQRNIMSYKLLARQGELL